MVHPLENPRKELRNFGFIMFGVLTGVFGLFLPWWKGHGYNPFFLAIGVAFVVFALAAPLALGPVFQVWMRIGAVLGWINSRILLGIVFFVLVFPMAMILRLRGWDAMGRSFKEQKETYREKKEYDNDIVTQMERPF